MSSRWGSRLSSANGASRWGSRPPSRSGSSPSSFSEAAETRNPRTSPGDSAVGGGGADAAARRSAENPTPNNDSSKTTTSSSSSSSSNHKDAKEKENKGKKIIPAEVDGEKSADSARTTPPRERLETTTTDAKETSPAEETNEPDASGSGSATSAQEEAEEEAELPPRAPRPKPPPPKKIIAPLHEIEESENFTYIEDVEWGPREDEPNYDPDQELAKRPKRQVPDVCACQPPARSSSTKRHTLEDSDDDEDENNDDNDSNGGTCCLDDSCILFACNEECSKSCPAGKACGNKRLQRKQFKSLQLIDAGRKGKGLLVMEDCRRGDLICEYTGEAIPQASLDRLFRRYQLDRRLYIMALGDGVYLDARKKGGWARFINHSCDPNCRVERWKVRGVLRAAVVAIQKIKAGDELSFDYKWERKRGRAPTVCHCSSEMCRGTLEVTISFMGNLSTAAATPSSPTNATDDAEGPTQASGTPNVLLDGHWERRSVADQTIVNRVVQVFSAEHNEYMIGEVTGYDGTKRAHSILYSHDMSEVWQDLSKEDWMLLDEKVDKEHFIIAKKVHRRPTAGSSLLAGAQRNGHNADAPTKASVSASSGGERVKHFLYVQTPVKDILWSKHIVESCQRDCGVQVQAEQMARPPLPMDPNDPEDVEKYQALDRSLDATVWKLNISGPGVQKAHAFLSKSVAHWDKKLAAQAAASLQTSSHHGPATAESMGSASRPINVTATAAEDASELIFPRIIVDAVKRRLPSIRDMCRGVNIMFAPSESKSKRFSKLTLEGNSMTDVNNAKEYLWKTLVTLCSEADAPMTLSRIHRNLGFFGGVLDGLQFRLLLNARKDRMHVDAGEDLNGSHFINSFESVYRCTVWVQAEEDKGRVDSSNMVVGETSQNSPRRVYFGCSPREIPRLWGLIQTRARELGRGVRFLYLGADRVYQALLMRNGGEFFKVVKKVTGASVTVDSTTGNHLRIDGREQNNPGTPPQAEHNTEGERAGLAEDLIRIQIEHYRDHSIRDHTWIFGRDWTLNGISLKSSPTHDAKPVQLGVSFGKLDHRSAASQCGMEIAEIIAALELHPSVAAHASIILYRFVHVQEKLDTNIKLREGILACIFLANKCQKQVKWKRLDAVVEAGYKVFYPGSSFDRKTEEVVVMKDKVISAEKEILESLEFDVFWGGVVGIRLAAIGAGKMKMESVEGAFQVAFSGPFLSAGAELWLKYGVEYVFAVAAAFLKAHLPELLNALSLIPLKMFQAAEMLVECAKFNRPTGSNMPWHPLLECGKSKLEGYLPRIKNDCLDAMKKGISESAPAAGHGPVAASAAEQRYRIIGKRSRRRRTVGGVPKRVVENHILRVVDGVAAESACGIYIGPSEKNSEEEDIVLEGSWRATAVAEHLLREKVRDAAVLPNSTDTSAQLLNRPKLQAKIRPGALKASDMQTSSGWEGTINASFNDSTSAAKLGGKSCIIGKTSEVSMREAGLRWWIPPKHCSSPSGSIMDTSLIRSNNGSTPLDAFGKLAKSFVCESTEFPALTSRLAEEHGTVNERFVPVSLQQWPPEKVASKETHGKEGRVCIGFSAAALQEMQLLTQLHGLVPSPQGHPNFVLPVAVALPGDESNKNGNEENRTTELMSLDDPMFSLFRSTEENEDAAAKEKTVKERPHLILQPAPLVIQRFVSSKTRTSDGPLVSLVVLAAWFHDLLSALVHCHSNNIVLRNILPDQFVVDNSGVAKLGSLYRSTISMPEDEKTSRKRKDDGDDYSTNQYAAPEMLLGLTRYGKETDVWAMGCMMASIMVSKPIFVGKDRSSLLLSHYKIVGTPAKGNYEEGAKLPNYKKPEKKYRRGVEKALEYMLKDKPEYARAIDLVSRMLHLDPKERCTAEEALAHDFMADYVDKSESSSSNGNGVSFRGEYVRDWLSLKRRMTGTSDIGTDRRRGTKDERRERRGKDTDRVSFKRRALMMASSSSSSPSAGANAAADDDLYSMDDLINDENSNGDGGKPGNGDHTTASSST